MAQDRMSGSPFASFWKAVFLPTPNIRDVVLEPVDGMDEHQLGTHFMPEYFLNTIDVIHFNCSIRFGRVCSKIEVHSLSLGIVEE